MQNFEVQVEMRRYIEERFRAVVLLRERLRDEQALLNEKEISLLRGIGGSWSWVRPDIGAMRVVGAVKDPASPTSNKRTKVVKELQATEGLALRISPICLEDLFGWHVQMPQLQVMASDLKVASSPPLTRRSSKACTARLCAQYVDI